MIMILPLVVPLTRIVAHAYCEEKIKYLALCATFDIAKKITEHSL